MKRSEILWRILTLHCDEAARLASGSLDRPLPGHDRLALRMHLLVCRSCRRHRRAILALREVAGRLGAEVDPPVPSLPDDARERIKKALREG